MEAKREHGGMMSPCLDFPGPGGGAWWGRRSGLEEFQFRAAAQADTVTPTERNLRSCREHYPHKSR